MLKFQDNNTTVIATFEDFILAYNLCIALNSIFGETCEIGKIKKLIF